MHPDRRAYKDAVAAKDWPEAIRLRKLNPDLLGWPPEGVSDEIAALATDPLEPGYMVVEWDIQKNACKTGCRPYLLQANASQFDHLRASATAEDVEAWFDGYIQNRREHPGCGQTLYLLKVERIERVTDFDGNKV